MKVQNIALELMEKIDRFSETGAFSDKSIYVWGFSKASYMSAQHMLERGLKVEAIIDNDSNLSGDVPKQYKNYVKVNKDLKICPATILEGKSDNAVILVFSRAYEAICKQAETLGFVKDKCLHFYSPNMYMNIEEFSGLKEIDVDERKTLQYEILKYFKRICVENNLKYYLAYGTLLGAIRHKGYIPWDDDIDVFMPWTDYIKLMEIMKIKEQKSNYSIQYFGMSDNYTWPFAKIQDDRTISRGIRFPLICDIGVNIDIFPLGGIPGNEEQYACLQKMVAEFQEHWACYLLEFHDSIDYSDIEKKIEEVMTRYSYDESLFIGYSIDGYWKWDKHSKQAFESSLRAQFEDEYFDIPIGYDEILTHAYGNYMEFPPNWQTLDYPHTYRAFWKK